MPKPSIDGKSLCNDKYGVNESFLGKLVMAISFFFFSVRPEADFPPKFAKMSKSDIFSFRPANFATHFFRYGQPISSGPSLFDGYWIYFLRKRNQNVLASCKKMRRFFKYGIFGNPKSPVPLLVADRST